MIKKLIIMLFCLFSTSAYSIDCSKHKIYCAIINLSPSINKTFAMELSNEIYKNSKIYGTDPLLTVAIAMQENSFLNRSVEIITTITRRETFCDDDGCVVKENTKEKKINDIGLFQINEHTANHYNFDIPRLKTDWKYSVQCHFQILKDKMKSCHNLGKHPWSCYHSVNQPFRQAYINKVLPLYKEISSK